ncbi:MAG: hypothetical protein EA369_07750 [Bradymonadales bacterium]|nr:MAG: hypothetical protein EA369_07750 [Bradymonadales bacterium]
MGVSMRDLILGLLVVNLALGGSGELLARNLENFRQTNQRAALLGIQNEFVDTNLEEAVNRELRRNINRYTTSYALSDVSNFRLANNPGGQFFRPNARLEEPQTNFLTRAAEENEIDLIVLAAIREGSVGLDLELQIFDARIMTLSGVESASFSFNQRVSAIEDLVYRIFDYLDREGFVHPTRQGFLQRPTALGGTRSPADFDLAGGDDFFLLPRDLSGPSLAGRVSVGGDKTPFWEEWWFWTLVFGGIALASGMSYYFLVERRPPSRSSVVFKFENP